MITLLCFFDTLVYFVGNVGVVNFFGPSYSVYNALTCCYETVYLLNLKSRPKLF